jgi:hypothetical protein
MCFSHAKKHMSILYVGCMKFPINQLYEIYVHSQLLFDFPPHMGLERFQFSLSWAHNLLLFVFHKAIV